MGDGLAHRGPDLGLGLALIEGGADRVGEGAQLGSGGGEQNMRWCRAAMAACTPALRRTNDVPVILLTAKGEEADRVLGFRFGADDYVVKPFSTAELCARIAAVLRRTGVTPADTQLHFDGLQIDLAKREVTVRGRPVDLPAREYEVLAFLASSPQRPFTRQQLLEQLWPPTAERNPGTVTEHVGRIRRRIEEDPERPRWIRTVHGVGYRFEP